MREILFRGKRIDNGEWVEGQLLYFKASVGTEVLALIVESCEWDNSNEWFNLGKRAKVIPETVGQCTGLKDKNGKLIFEGDIVYCKSRLDNANMVIIFECGQFRMVLSENYRSYQTNSGFYDINCFDKEVIGNIHDNSLEDFRSER